MSTEKLKRIMWRLREKYKSPYSLMQVTDAIWEEIGMDKRTVDKYRALLIAKGLLRPFQNQWRFEDCEGIV